MNDQVATWFRRNKSTAESAISAHARLSTTVSWWRVVCFTLLIGLVILSISTRQMTLLILGTVVILAIFAYLVKYHNRIKNKIRFLQEFAKLNDNEVKRLTPSLSGFPLGKEFINPQHHYSTDLDIFGSHSLFQFMDRTATKEGKEALAHAMLHRSTKSQILDRQNAVKELKKKPEWLLEFLSKGHMYREKSRDPQMIHPWFLDLTHPDIPSWYWWVLSIFPATSVVMLTAFFAGYLHILHLIVLVIVNGFILKKVNTQAEETYKKTYESIQTLKIYRAMIDHLENSDFKSSLLQSLQRPFTVQSTPASKIIEDLSHILSRIELRMNMFYWIFNIFFLLDLIWLIQVRNWKNSYGSKVSEWFQAINQVEFISCLSLTAYANPDWAFPTISDTPHTFQASELGHPLIDTASRVHNDFNINGTGSIVILTGSNMSGKTTFLRTIGVNTVLAHMGAPCCARSLEVGLFEIFTSMRTTDSLEQHISSFYAELKRLNQLIQRVQQPDQAVLFLLDEILKGTNSQDRHRGATGLIKQLHESTGFGVISTHDLALGELAESISQLQNFSFNSKLINNQLIFDYTLTPGLCNSFNASELMAQMGIQVYKGDQI